MKAIRLYAILVLLLLLGSCAKKREQQDVPVFKVMTVKATNQILQASYPVTVKGVQYVEVRPQISGVIRRIYIKEGARVSKGQTLFVIDQAPYQTTLDEANACIQSARTKLATAALTLKNSRTLAAKHIIGAYELRSTANAYREAVAAVKETEATRAKALSGLSYTVIKSPVSGVASMIPYHIGALVTSSIETPLVTVSDDSKVYAYFSLTENQLLDMAQQNAFSDKRLEELMPPVKLTLNNGTPYQHSGKVDAISGVVEASTGNVTVRAVFTNSEHLLRNGSSAEVVIPTTHHNVLTIPQEASYQLQDKYFVYKVIGGKTHATAISVEDVGDGKMSSIAEYLKITKVYGSESQTRFNLFPAIRVNGSAASGYSSGQAIKAINEVASQTLPAGYGYEFGGMTREEASNTGSQTVLVFVACIVFIYLFLCALYESVFIPLAVIHSVPFGLCGSFIFANLFGLENNIYMQTGVIMLIGLLSKTAILLTQYATEKHQEGMTIYQAAIAAAKIRLRPILMTSLTMVIGMLPMAFASGAGANGSRSLGLTTAGGMAMGTLFMVFIVPCLYIFFQKVDERVMPRRRRK